MPGNQPASPRREILIGIAVGCQTSPKGNTVSLTTKALIRAAVIARLQRDDYRVEARRLAARRARLAAARRARA